MTRVQRLLLRVTVFASGALLMALEVAAFHIIAKTFGAALRETTTVIAVFLAAMAAGYWAGGRAGDRWPHPSTLCATLFAAAVACFAVPWIDAWLSPRISASGLALPAHAFVATSILFAIPAFLLSATSPIAVRLFTRSTGESGSTAGSISAISTSGSIAGSLITAFFLIHWLESVSRTVIFVGLGAALTGALALLASAKERRTGSFAIAGALIVILSGAFVRSHEIDHSFLKPLPSTRVLFLADSPYHRITVMQRGPWRELFFTTAAVQSKMLVGDPFGPGLSYSDSGHLPRLMRPGTRRVLMIGLGGGTLPKQYAHYYPDTVIDVVDVDPLVADVARRFFELRTSDRLRVHIADGRTFLRRSGAKWDLILIDAYTTNRYGDTIPSHLTTREFFEEAASHLTPDGIFYFHCAFHRSALLPAIHHTIAGVFPHVVRSHGEIIASAAPLPDDRAALARLAKASPAARLPSLQSAIAALTNAPPPPDAQLLTDDYAPVDRLLRR